MADEELNQGMDLNLDSEDSLSQISTALKAAKILERSRAEGIPLKDLALDMQGGKVRAVTQQEKKASDEIRRKELIQRLRQRSIRGDSSLADDIGRRLRQCQEWIDYISRFSSVTEKDLLSIRRNIESTNNRAASLVKEVTVLEMAIQRKKEEDPIIVEVEKASADLMEAIKNQEFERVAELRQYCEQNMPLYNSRKKRLKPYFAQARQARLKFISEKRQVMRMQFETGGQVSELLAQDLNSGKFQQFDAESLHHAAALVQELRELRSTSRSRIDRLSHPVMNVALSFIPDLEKEMDVIDLAVIVPFEEKVNDLMTTIGAALKQLREEIAQGETSAKETSRRMAYQVKKDKN